VPRLDRRQLDPLHDLGSPQQISRSLQALAETAPLLVDLTALEAGPLVARAG